LIFLLGFTALYFSIRYVQISPLVSAFFTAIASALDIWAVRYVVASRFCLIYYLSSMARSKRSIFPSNLIAFIFLTTFQHF
jgi:hypothetical protein